MPKHLLLRIHPGDYTLLALLALANLVSLIRWPHVGAPLTPIALALIGLLQAQAVATCEMHLPAVMSVRGVMKALTNGESVSVDGNRGTVKRNAEPPA